MTLRPEHLPHDPAKMTDAQLLAELLRVVETNGGPERGGAYQCSLASEAKRRNWMEKMG